VKRSAFALSLIVSLVVAGSALAAAPRAVVPADGDLGLVTDSSRLGSLAARPELEPLDAIVHGAPAVRLHFPAASIVRLPDADLDGVPDRASRALTTTLATLALCERLGLGRPADDGDGEIDVYLLPLDGRDPGGVFSPAGSLPTVENGTDVASFVRGYTALESGSPLGTPRSGFVVADISPTLSDGAFVGIVARGVARLVLAGHDAHAPEWWIEASAAWIERRVVGPSDDLELALQARWSEPERGLAASLPLAARGNAGLVWALGDAEVEGRALAETWRALTRRSPDRAPADVVAGTLARRALAPFEDVLLHAGLRQVVTGPRPRRWAAVVGGDRLDTPPHVVEIAPRGAALVRVDPAPTDSEGTRVEISGSDELWVAHLAARRGNGEWDRVVLSSSDGGFEAVVPWSDYDEAVIVVAREGAASRAGELSIRAEPLTTRSFFGLASFSTRKGSMGLREISWVTAWERGIAAFLVETAEEADGPWTLAQRVPLPAVGDARRGSSYVVHDPATHATTDRYYRVVALTEGGLRVSGPPIASASR
jgi:hypothetical protein